MPSSACDWSSDVCSSDRSEEHTSELQSRSDLVCRLLLRSEEHTSELQSRSDLVCRLLLEKKNNTATPWTGRAGAGSGAAPMCRKTPRSLFGVFSPRLARGGCAHARDPGGFGFF